MPKASQAENKRDSDSIINRLTDYQNIRLSEKQRSRYRHYREQISHRRAEIREKPYRKSIEKFQKKFCQKLRSMRFLPISLPSLLYVDSSPLVLYPRSRLNPPCVSETRLCFRTPPHNQNTGCRSQTLSVTDYMSL